MVETAHTLNPGIGIFTRTKGEDLAALLRAPASTEALHAKALRLRRARWRSVTFGLV